MASIINLTKTINTSDFTLIIPCISVGNVGQLTIDLLISSYDFKKVGAIWHPAFIPIVGGDAYNSNSSEICTACELYANEALKVAAIQIRSGIEGSLASQLFAKLNNLVEELKFKEVFILTSAFAHEMHTVSSSKFRYLTNDNEIKGVLQNVEVLPLEELIDGGYAIYGGGFAVKLYNELSAQVRRTLISKYSSEGDNRPDAMQFVELLKNVISSIGKSNSKEFKYPISWQYVFGNPPPVGMY